MKQLLIAAMVLAAGIASGYQEREAYPGQREHKEPPKGWMCTSHPSVPKNSPHHCECKRMCAQGPDGRHVIEDSKCKVYCHPKSCTCPSGCEST